MGEIYCKKHDSVWVLTIANPEKRNAFSGDMAQALFYQLNEAEVAPHVRCIVITGAGEVAFSSGHDLNEMRHQGGSATAEHNVNAGFVRPALMSKPTIAAVNGHAYGAGFIIALSCDLRVVSKNAAFCASGARMGLLPIGGQISRLPCLIPHARAMELLLTGAPMGAQEAYALGFANRLVTQGRALVEALEMAKTIAGNSPTVVREIKRGIAIRMRDGPEAAQEFERTIGAEIKNGPDHREGIRAFLEKRSPKFPDHW